MHNFANNIYQRAVRRNSVAGAALPAQTRIVSSQHSSRLHLAYIQKVREAGGIDRYERIHLNALNASFVPKFAHRLPPEIVRLVVEYAFHVGYY